MLLPLFATLIPSPVPQVGPSADPAAAVDRRVQGVVTHDGRPVEGATVHLRFRKYPLAGGVSELARAVVERTTVTSERGEFLVEGPPWRPFTLHATKARLASGVSGALRLPQRSVEIRLAAGWTVAARLTHRGRPIARPVPFRLELQQPEQDAVPLEHAGTTGAGGELRVGGLPPGPWLLRLGARDVRLAQPVVLDDASGAGPAEVPLRDAVELTGQLADTKGEPLAVAGVRVELQDVRHVQETTTDNRGRFTLGGLGSDSGAALLFEGGSICKALGVSEPGMSPRDPSPQIPLRTKPGAPARGMLADATGRPAAGVEVLFKGRRYPTWAPIRDLSVLTRTDGQGRFATSRLDQRAMYEVLAVLPDGEVQSFRYIIPGVSPADVGLLRIGGTRVRAKVGFAFGQTDPGLELRIYGPKEARTGGFQHLAPIGGDRWLAPVLASGSYCLIALSAERGLTRREIVVSDRAGPVLDVDLPAPGKRRVHGLVHANREPRPRWLVSLVPAGAAGEGGSTKWSDPIAMRLLEERWPATAFPRSMVTGPDGTYAIWVLESSGDHDLVAERQPGPGEPAGAGQVVRIPGIGDRTGPIDIEVGK